MWLVNTSCTSLLKSEPRVKHRGYLNLSIFVYQACWLIYMNISTAALFSSELFIENFHVAFLLSVNIYVYFQMDIMLKTPLPVLCIKTKFIHEQPVSKIYRIHSNVLNFNISDYFHLKLHSL